MTRAATIKTNTIVAPIPTERTGDDDRAENSQHRKRVRCQPVAQPESSKQHARQDEKKHDVGAVGDDGEPADELREFVAVRVPLGRVVEHEEVEPLTLHRGQHLEADDEHDVSVAGQRAQGRAFGCGIIVLELRELGRMPAPGDDHQRGEHAGRGRGGDEQSLGATKEREHWRSAKTTGDEPKRETCHHAA